MTGLTRPELLVSTSWLAENISRPELRILDARWRPDGSGPATFAAGHIPAAAYLDWRSELIEPAEEDEVLLLAAQVNDDSEAFRHAVDEISQSAQLVNG